MRLRHAAHNVGSTLGNSLGACQFEGLSLALKASDVHAFATAAQQLIQVPLPSTLLKKAKTVAIQMRYSRTIMKQMKITNSIDTMLMAIFYAK